MINGIHYSELGLRKVIREKLGDAKISDWERSLFQFIDIWLDESDIVEVKTSGSTGTPKVIQLQKEKMVLKIY